MDSIAQAWDNNGDIVVGNDVWIGYEAIILAGVTIGDGAIIGSRAVVTHDVPPYTILGGIPAMPIRRRFDDVTIEKLEALRWWDWDEEKIKRNIPAIQSGDMAALERAERNNADRESGMSFKLKYYTRRSLSINPHDMISACFYKYNKERLGFYSRYPQHMCFCKRHR